MAIIIHIYEVTVIVITFQDIHNYGGGHVGQIGGSIMMLKSQNTKNNSNLRPTINISKLELAIHDLTNIERQKRNLSLLAFDSEIREICRRHSEDMSVRNYFEHTNPDGIEPMDRAKAANFDFEKNLAFDLATHPLDLFLRLILIDKLIQQSFLYYINRVKV